MVEAAARERRKPRRKQSKFRLAILSAILVTLASIWWLQRRDRLDQALLLAVLELDRVKVHSLLESGVDANVHFGAFSARQQNTGLIEWFLNLIRTRRVERRPNDRTALFAAVSSADVVIARDLLDHGANVNVSAGRGMTPLLTAVSRTDPVLPLLLLERGANWKVRSAEGLSPLQLACRIGNTPVVKALLDRGASVVEKDKRGWTPLMIAAENKQDETVRLLLERGAPLEDLRAFSPSPFLWAAQVGSPDLIRKLWAGLSVAERISQGREALRLAVATRRAEAVQALLDREVTPTRDPKTGVSPLMVAATVNDVPLMELLVKHGAGIEDRDTTGRTALIAAQNVPRAVEFLLRHGANPNAADLMGRTALFQAFDLTVVKLLLDRGASPNLRDKSGATPIHYCFSPVTVQLLLQRHADPNIPDNQGVTPLMKAVNQLNPTLVQLLLSHGARVNDADATGQTALAIAQNANSRTPSNQPSITDMLKAKGAVASVPKSQWRGTPAPVRPVPLIRNGPARVFGGAFSGALGGGPAARAGGTLPVSPQQGRSLNGVRGTSSSSATPASPKR